MATTNTTGVAPPEIAPDVSRAVDESAWGIGNLDEARQAAREVDAIREANRRKFGEEPIGVAIIREFRGPLPE